jgi:peptide/nickel transport system permease protein
MARKITSQAPTVAPLSSQPLTRQSIYSPAVREFVKNRAAVAGVVVLCLIFVATSIPQLLTPYDPVAISAELRVLPPSLAHPLGTDDLGRDILSRVLYGGRISLTVGLLSVALAFLIGVPLGLVAGYFGGLVDNSIMRVMDIVLAFPGIIFAIWLISLLGMGLTNVILAITFWLVPTYARLAHGSTLSVRELDYITAEQCIGASHSRILFRHIFPNILAPLVVMASMNISGAIITGASLSFLGLGVRPPTPEWGAMLSDGRGFLRNAWWMAFFPGIVITSVVLAANMIGDGLRDALDPRIRGSR